GDVADRHHRGAPAHDHRGARRARAGSGGSARDGEAPARRVHVSQMSAITTESAAVEGTTATDLREEAALAALREKMNIVIVGHVDHGKSTLVGRLLADTESFPEDKLEKVRAICARQGKQFEYAFLLDALEAEQDQGITIDS